MRTYLRRHLNGLAAKERDCITVAEASDAIIAALRAREISMAMIMGLVADSESNRKERPLLHWESDLPTAPSVLDHFQIFSS